VERRWGALAGVAAAAGALGVAEIVAAPIGPLSAPLLAVGGVVVDNVPEPVKQFGISVFGVHDKTALITGTAILLLAYAALVGILALRARWMGVAGIGVFAVVGVAAAVTRHDAGAVAAVPTLVGAVVAGGVLWFLLQRVPDRAVPSESPTMTGRRRFLISSGAVVGVAAVAGVGGRWLTSRRAVTAARAAVRLPVPVQAAPPVPVDAELGLPGLARYVTPNSDFYRIDTALYAPQVDPETWELRIHGMVEREVRLSFADLLARPQVERWVTLACVSNEVGGDLIGNACWLGVLVKDLLLEAGPLAGADQVVSRSADGWTCGTPTAALLDGRDAILAVGMNGEPLPVEHGFPVRMVVPGLYGYVSACKWIVELEVTRFADFDAYWVPRGWSREAPVKTQARIDTPRGDRKAGTVTVAGVAWAQRRGITGVQVQVDDGPWQDATLAGAVSIDTWRQWSLSWAATPGTHTVRVRATDATGAVQPEATAPPAPDGATGWHTVSVKIT
jgi:DMSO/TMAO reductase YedYZ molybdopterin-dependent catalytic subunit